MDSGECLKNTGTYSIQVRVEKGTGAWEKPKRRSY